LRRSVYPSTVTFVLNNGNPVKINNMKKIFFSTSFIFVIFLCSCNSDVVNNSSKNYWEQNAWVRMQLKGKVKTLTVNDISGTKVIQFYENGLISTETNTGTGYSSVSTNTYSSDGQLAKTVTVSSNQGSASTTGTVTYEYASHGRYIPAYAMHMYDIGLTLNLKAVINDWGRTDYTFNGDNLYIITSNTVSSVKDTSIIKFSGKYPESITTSWSFGRNISYADNGMFKTYTEGFYGTGYEESRAYVFKTDEEYLLKESVTSVNTLGTATTTSVQTYTYNDKKDLIKIVEGENVEEYINYVYDTSGNWTSRTHRSKYAGSTTVTTDDPVTRTIVYW
jgi:hypothetical protein